jgi:hypothetical protein
MNLVLSISPHGRLHVESPSDEDGSALPAAASKRISEAFHEGTAQGILHLATAELESSLPASFSFAREWGRAYLTQLCHRPESQSGEAWVAQLQLPTAGPSRLI